MKHRRLEHAVLTQLTQFPAVALLGPRQVGKTTLAEHVVAQQDAVYLDLELPSDQRKLDHAEHYLSSLEDKLVVIDEVQRAPMLFQILRGLIDQGRKKGRKQGRFLLLGSASGALLQQSGESLAGRIAYLELAPFDLSETGHNTLLPLWIKGGFPDSFLTPTEQHSMNWRQQFIRTYLERDIPQLGTRIPAETLRRFWTMLAHRQGELLNSAQLAKSLAVDGKTIARYLDLLVDLLLVRRLRPWHGNVGKRLVKSPKVYVRDSGIMHALLGITDYDMLMGHPNLGASWEGFVIENIINVLPSFTETFFYRTSAGAEVDLVIVFPNQQRWLVEIKHSTAPKLSKGFYQAIKDLSPEKSFVVYTGSECYSMQPGINMIDLTSFLALLTPPTR